MADEAQLAGGDRHAALVYLAARAAATGQARPEDRRSSAGLFDISGKLVVLTNAGNGGSAEIADLLASSGAHVVIADRDMDRALAIAATIRARGEVALAIETDVEDEASVAASFAAIAKAAGRFDVLVNTAGMGAHKDLLETSLALWDDVQSINLRASFLCMREGLRAMVAAGHGGRIVNVTTIGGLHPVMNGNGPYAAARLGVKALGESTALDYVSHGVLVNTLMVGAVANRTAVHPQVLEELKQGRALTGPSAGAGRLPLGMGDNLDVAAAVLFLVSPASRFVTGQSLVLDGGFLIT